MSEKNTEREAQAVAWMTDDGRVARSETKRIMPNSSKVNFNIPLYLAPPSAPSIETAAIMKCAEVCGQIAENYYPHRADEGLVAEKCEQSILALIPQDGRTAMFDKCMEVANVSNNGVRQTEEELHTIVTNLIGVPPLNSDAVSEEK